MEIFKAVDPPEYWNAAAENFGGPKCPFALLEAPTPSRGIPTKFVSNLSFEFSSWKTDTAYVPDGTLRNSQVACPPTILELACASALSVFFGKSAAEENNAHRTCPRSLRNPSISTRILFA